MNRRLALASIPAAALAAVALWPASAGAGSKDYKVIEVKDGGSVRGTCKLVGDAGALPKLSIFKDNDKGCGDKERPTERAVTGEGGALANCVVYLKSVAAGKDWPKEMLSEDRTGTIDQKGCRYVPHMQWLRPKTQMVILNSDGADHNIHGFKDSLKDTKFNFASAPGTKNDSTDSAFLEDAAMYIVKCDIHPWMSAYVHVVDHPYYDVTSAESANGKKPGEFLIEGIPPGDYELVCWHEGMKESPTMQDGKIASYSYSDPVTDTKSIKIAAGQSLADQNFDVPLK